TTGTMIRACPCASTRRAMSGLVIAWTTLKTLGPRPAVSYDAVSPWMKSTMPIPSTAIGSRATSPAREHLSAPGSAKISEYVRSRRPILRRASGQCRVDERAGLLLHLREVLGTAEGLGVDLEDVLGAGRAGREPRVLGADHQYADRRAVAGVLVTSCALSSLSAAFCAGVAGASIRA